MRANSRLGKFAMGINNDAGDTSDWQFSRVYIWNKWLSDSNFESVVNIAFTHICQVGWDNSQKDLILHWNKVFFTDSELHLTNPCIFILALAFDLVLQVVQVFCIWHIVYYRWYIIDPSSIQH